MKILHVDSGNEWRGGQQQLVYLSEFLNNKNIANGVVCRAGSPLHAYLKKTGTATFPWQPKGDWEAANYWKLKKIVETYAPDIIHAHDARSILFALWSGRQCRKKVIAHRRVDFPVSRLSILLKYKHLDKIIAVSEKIKSLLLEQGMAADKVTVIYDGIDLSRFGAVNDKTKMRSTLGIPLAAFHVGNVGSLVDHKGQIYLIEAAAKLIPDFPDLYFTIAGAGELREKLQKRIRELRIAEHFLLAGFISTIPSYLSSLDMYVQPSKLEGLGSAIIEAMACGLPVIAADSGGIPEIVRHFGILFKARDPFSLAAAISELLCSRQRQTELARLSLLRSQTFDFRNTNSAVITIYQELLQ